MTISRYLAVFQWVVLGVAWIVLPFVWHILKFNYNPLCYPMLGIITFITLPVSFYLWFGVKESS